jgi:hypothetical protein
MTLDLTFIFKTSEDLTGSLALQTFSPIVLSKCLRIRAQGWMEAVPFIGLVWQEAVFWSGVNGDSMQDFCMDGGGK